MKKLLSVFRSFLGEITAQQFCFEINWPLMVDPVKETHTFLKADFVLVWRTAVLPNRPHTKKEWRRRSTNEISQKSQILSKIAFEILLLILPWYNVSDTLLNISILDWPKIEIFCENKPFYVQPEIFFVKNWIPLEQPFLIHLLNSPDFCFKLIFFWFETGYRIEMIYN